MVASQPARQRKARLNQRCFCRSARFRDKRPRAGSATFSTPRASASLSFLAEKKSAIGRSHLRKVPKASLMLVECRHPGVGVCRIALQNFITAHEAMLHFVEAHQPAKLVCAFPLRITCVCGSNKLSTLPSTCVFPSHTRCLVWEITFSTKGRKCRNCAACFSTSRRLPTTFSRPDLQRGNTSLACRTTFRRSEEHTSELQSRGH